LQREHFFIYEPKRYNGASSNEPIRISLAGLSVIQPPRKNSADQDLDRDMV